MTLIKAAQATAVCWTVLLFTLLGFESYESWQRLIVIARTEAATAFEKDLLYHTWNASHGGVYAPINALTQPNPYLSHIPERDVTTPSGRRMTLVNPTDMIRQVYKLGGKGNRPVGHIISLSPIHPGYAPDSWEAQSLKRLEKGRDEVSSVELINGERSMRLMRPLKLEERCRQCHEGHAKGDILGGFSISLPLQPLWEVLRESIRDELVIFGLLWLAGLGMVYAGSVQLLRKIDDTQSERKLAQSKLETAYGTMRDIIDNAPFGIFLVNEDGALEYVNPAMLTIAGNTYEEFTSLNAFTLPSYEKIGLSEKIRRGIKGDYFQMNAVKFTPSLGHKTTIRNFTGIPLSESGMRKVLLIVEDVTERTRLEDQLRQAQKMEVIGQFAGGIAHDFNNILTGIIGYGTLMRMKMAEDDPSIPNLTQMLALSDKAAGLTRSLLAFSRKQVMELKPLAVNEAVEGLQKILSRLIGEDIEVSVTLSPENPIVMADKGQIEQVLMNLATNARDAMPHGGTLFLSTGCMEIDDVFIKVHRYGNAGRYGLLTVADTGAGMEEMVRERIFEPFFTTKEVGRGTGLGLSMAYGIIKQHNGFITVYSEPGEGTVFKIYLPLADSEGSPGAVPDEPPPRGENRTILIAEDNREVRDIARGILEEFGYRVLEAADGEEAVSVFAQSGKDIQLVIFDCIMPKKNGRDAYDEIRKTAPGIKALFMSGYTADTISSKGILDPDMEFISKPIVPREFLKKIAEILNAQNKRTGEK